MVAKRKNEDRGTNAINVARAGSSTQRKKVRLDEARKISVQSGTPSAQGTNTSSMEGLPSTIDVEKFAEARAFEINAMQEAMNNVATAGTQRVWQSLPRHLRRRAASHDVRYVPARLRQKARVEMDTPAHSKTKKKLPRRGVTKTKTRTEVLLKRQKDKTWLETYIWHAKRMHMENMWGYRLARTPTEKSFRPSHRASLHGCILHDASYEAIIELKGPDETLKEILAGCSDPQEVSPGAARFISGSRVCYAHMYKPKAYPLDLIGPVVILWKAISAAQPQAESRGKKSNQKEAVSTRTVWIRCHPVIYDVVMSTVTYCVQACLQLAQSTSEKEINVEVADLRDQFNVFELVGSKSSQVIHGALSPVKDEDRDEFNKFWQTLGQLQTAGSAPRGMVIGLKVLDPRLNFPPKNTKVKANEKTNETASVPAGLWPTAKLATAKIWDGDVREKVSKPRYKKKDIDARKSKYLVPGSKLNPLRQDDRVPVLLIQRSIEPQISSSSSSFNLNIQSPPNSTRHLHGWSLIIPKGWGMPFFSSLTYTGTRVAGQDEIVTQRFEAGCSTFPMDYPCTEAYTTHMTESGKEERERWERKPPAKRPNWEKLGTENPWMPDWVGLLGLRKTGEELEAKGDLVPTQREVAQRSAENEETNASTENVGRETDDSLGVQPWLFRGPEALATIETLSYSPNPAPDLLAKVNTWRNKRSLPPLSLSADTLFRSALVNVRLSIPRSGSPENNAIIFKMNDEEARQWRSLVNEEDGSEFTETQLSELKYSKDCIVGYVTSGHYSLSIGRGQAIGALTLASYLSVKEQLYRLGKPRSLPLVKIRNKDSPICRAALVELLC